jgi:hypothetical protein
MNGRKRTLAFAGATVVLLGSTGFLTLHDSHPADGDARTERPAGPSAMRAEPPAESELDAGGDARGLTSPASPATSTTPYPTGATRGEREARGAPAVAPGDARAAVAAARAFLEGYLPYSYGRAKARRIRAAAAPLLREFETAPPRVPANVTRARPMLVSVRAETTTGGSDVDVVALVDDGRRRYRIPLAVRDTGRRWVVTAISG